MANLGKKGNLGLVCKIHDTGRWQKIDPMPQKYMSSGVALQNLSKKNESEKS